MRTYEETDLYESAVNYFFDENNPDCIHSLMKGFSDATENEEVMFSNLHGIKYFLRLWELSVILKDNRFAMADMITLEPGSKGTEIPMENIVGYLGSGRTSATAIFRYYPSGITSI